MTFRIIIVLNVILLKVRENPFMTIAIMLSFIMLNVIMLNLVMLGSVASRLGPML